MWMAVCLAGELRQTAAVHCIARPGITAAAGGVIVPALAYLMLLGGDDALRDGWAIPIATGIAFTVAVLVLIGSHLSSALRILLLPLAMAADPIATIIAVFYTASFSAGVAVGGIDGWGQPWGTLAPIGCGWAPASMDRGIRAPCPWR